MLMYLNDRKVLKHFGPNPERGRLLKGCTKRVTVGMRWNLPKQKWEPDPDVTVTAVLALKRVKHGCWDVLIDPAFTRHAEQYLRRNCQ